MASFQQNSSGRWKATIRRKGFPQQIATFDTKAQAKAWARDVETRIDRGVYEDLTAARSTTLIEAMEAYSRIYTDGKKGARQERNRISLWSGEPMARKPLSDIRPKDVSEWVASKSHLAPSTIRNLLTIVSQTYKFAISELGIEGIRNPVPGVKLPRHNPGRDRRLEGDERERLLSAATELELPIVHDIIIVAIETACRRGELLSLQLEDVHEKVALLRDTKIGKPRVVPLSPLARQTLQSRGTEGPAFPFKDCREMERQWYKVLDHAGIDNLHFHDLRHHGVSSLFEKGLSTEQVMAVSGHTTYASLSRYTHLRSSQIADLL